MDVDAMNANSQNASTDKSTRPVGIPEVFAALTLKVCDEVVLAGQDPLTQEYRKFIIYAAMFAYDGERILRLLEQNNMLFDKQSAQYPINYLTTLLEKVELLNMAADQSIAI